MAQTGYTPILIYSSSTTTNAPAAGNLTNSTLGSELAINITDGKLFYKDNANAIQVIGWKTTPTTAGGTGLISYTAGDMLYYASGTALSKLAIGANTTIMTSSGSAPQWSAASGITVGTATNIAGGAAGSVPYQTGAGATSLLGIGTAYYMLGVNAGATAPSWQPSATSVLTTQGDLLYASAANTLARLAKNTTATRYLSNTGASNNPAWAQIDLSNGVTGTLPVGNGGTGATTFTAGRVLFGNSTSAINTSNNLFWDNSNNRFGINNALPGYSLDVNGNLRTYSTAYLNNQYSGGGTASVIYCDNSNSTGGASAFWGRYKDVAGGSVDGVRFDALNDANTAVVPAVFRANPFVVFGGNGEAFRADANSYLLVGYTSSNGAYRLQVNSQIFATSATIATSDGNYKEDQTPINGALDLVTKLQPKTFRWKQGQAADGVLNPNYGKPKSKVVIEMQINENGDRVAVEKQMQSVDEQKWLREPHNFPDGINIGFIAQEVAETLKDQPYLSNIIKKNTRPAVFDNGLQIAPESEFLGIAEGNMIALLTAALKEFKAEFDQYKATHP